MVNAQSYPNLRPNSHSTICSQICGYTTRNHVYGQNNGDQPWVIFASGLRMNNQQSRGIQPLPAWRDAAIVLERPGKSDQSYARRPCSHDQGLYTLWGCHMVLLVQSYGWLPTGCNNVRYISKQQQQWFHRVAKWPRSSRRESKHSAQEFLDVVVMFFFLVVFCRAFWKHPTLCRHGTGAERQHHCWEIRRQGLSRALANP